MFIGFNIYIKMEKTNIQKTNIKNTLSIKMTQGLFNKKVVYNINTTKGLFCFYNIVDLTSFINNTYGVNL